MAGTPAVILGSVLAWVKNKATTYGEAIREEEPGTTAPGLLCPTYLE